MRSTISQSTFQLGGKAKKPIDLLGFIRRYGVLMVVGGLFVLTMLVPLVLKVASPDYEVKASLKIDPVVAALISQSDELSITSFYHDYVRTQARRMKEYSILEKAITRTSQEDRQAVFHRDLPASEGVVILQRILNITPIPGTHLLELTLRGANQKGLAQLLNNVVEVYLEMMEAELANKYQRRLAYLTEKSKELEADIVAKDEELKKVAATVLSSTFVEDFNIWQKKAVDLQEAYVRSFSQRVENENAFIFQKKLTEQLGGLSLAPLVDEAVMDNRAIDYTSSWTYQQLQNMRASIDGVTKENEDRKRVEGRMLAMREYETKLRRETRSTLESVVNGKRELELKEELIRKENAYLQAKQAEETLADALEQAKVESGRNSSSLLHSRTLSTELEHARDMLFRINNRLQELEAESRAPLRVTVESRALEPDSPAGSNIRKLLLACVAASFGSVGGLFLLLELLDNRLHSTADLVRALGHSPAWPISKGPVSASFIDLLREHRHSRSARAIRSLATRLFQDFQENGSKVFLFTGVDRHCGTSEIMLNTAEALTRHAGRILVVDTNLGHDDLSRILSVDHSRGGLEELLSGGHTLEQCIYRDPTRGFDVLLSRATSSQELGARQLQAFLDEAKAGYDLICFDSGPVMQSDFTEYLAVNADVTVLISLGDSTLYRDLRRTAELFIGLGVPAMAAVLNWGGTKKKNWLDEYLDRIPGKLRGDSRSSRLTLNADKGVES